MYNISKFNLNWCENMQNNQFLYYYFFAKNIQIKVIFKKSKIYNLIYMFHFYHIYFELFFGCLLGN